MARSLSSGAIWNVGLRVWTLAITFFLTPFLIARLGLNHYGLYVILMTVTGFMSILNFGFGEASIRHIAFYFSRDDLAGLNRTVGNSLAIFLGTGTLGALIMILAARQITVLFNVAPAELDFTVRLVRLIAVTLLLEFAGSVSGSVPAALERFDIKSKLDIAQSIVQVGGSVVLLLLGRGIEALVLWNIVASLFKQIAGVVAARALVPQIRLRPSISRAGLRDVLGYSASSIATNALGLIWANADRLILGSLVGTSAVAYLSVSQQITQRASQLVSGAGAGLLPRFSTMSDGAELRKLYLDVTFLMLATTIILFVPVSVLMPDFLRLWIGADFAAKSARIGQVIAVSYLIRGGYYPFHMLFGALNKPYLMTLHSLANAVISLILNVVLISRYGLMGAGYSFLATAAVGSVTIFLTWKYLLREASALPLLRALGLPVLLAILSLLVCGAVRHLCGAEIGWVWLFALSGLFSLVSAALVMGTEYAIGRGNSHIRPLLALAQRYRIAWAR